MILWLYEATSILYVYCSLQDMEVTYFQAYIDGVDFVFIDTPMLRHIENNIYGGGREVRYPFLQVSLPFLRLNIFFLMSVVS